MQLRSSGNSAWQRTARNPAEIRRMVGEVLERFGRIDILVNRIGEAKSGHIHASSGIRIADFMVFNKQLRNALARI